ncbi:hypothetical protein JAG44_003403, partial [Citrobacter koseri]
QAKTFLYYPVSTVRNDRCPNICSLLPSLLSVFWVVSTEVFALDVTAYHRVQFHMSEEEAAKSLKQITPPAG